MCSGQSRDERVGLQVDGDVPGEQHQAEEEGEVHGRHQGFPESPEAGLEMGGREPVLHPVLGGRG